MESQNEHTEIQGHDLTTGDIRRQIWSLAWPVMLSLFFFTLYNIVDAFWVGKLSADAIAAVSVSQTALFIMVALSMGITVGSGVLISMHIGAKEKHEAERVLGQSFVLSTIAAVIFTAIAIVFCEPLLAASGAVGTIFDPALSYFIPTAWASVLVFVMFTIIFAFNAQGDTFTPTKLFAISTFVNAVLDPLLIFGWYGFPELGIAGAAYATIISQIIFVSMALYMLARPERMIPFRMRNLTFRWESVKQVLKIGIPASLTQAINPLGLALLMFITSHAFLEAGTIAFSIGFRVEFFAFLPAVGFGVGAMALIGQNIGAGNIARAKEAYRTALCYGVAAAVAFGLGAMACAFLIIRVFTTDPLVTEYAHSYIFIIATTYGFLAAMNVEASAFQAIGKSWPGFFIFFIRFVVVSIPLAYLSSEVLQLPIAGVWCSIAAGNIVAAIAGYFWFRYALSHLHMEEVPVHVENAAG